MPPITIIASLAYIAFGVLVNIFLYTKKKLYYSELAPITPGYAVTMMIVMMFVGLAAIFMITTSGQKTQSGQETAQTAASRFSRSVLHVTMNGQAQMFFSTNHTRWFAIRTKTSYLVVETKNRAPVEYWMSPLNNQIVSQWVSAGVNRDITNPAVLLTSGIILKTNQATTTK